MKTVFEHIEYLKGKPHHIRKQVAFGSAASIAAIIALVWLVTSVGSGTFALKNPTPEEGSGDGSLFVPGREDGSQNLAGAAAALQDESAPARIEIIDTTPAAPRVKPIEQTTLPF